MPTTYEDLVQLEQASVRAFASRRLFGQRRGDLWTWTTYAEFGEQVEEVRGGLAALGVKPGDRVAIVSRNSVAWAVCAYATYGLGATFVPMYEAQRPEEWQFILDDCGASVVLGRGAAVVSALDAMRTKLPAVRHVIDLEGASGDPRSLVGLRRAGRERAVPALHPGREAIATLIYTSGTTGKPKGVILTHHNLTSNIAATTARFPIVADDVTLSFLPWAHVYGQIGDLHIVLSVGAATAFSHDVEHLVDDLQAVRPTMLVSVPRIFNKIHTSVRTQIASKPRPIRALFRAGLEASIRERRGVQLAPHEQAVRWLADRLVFAKIRHKFGGRLKYAISASATLSLDVAEFIDGLGLDVYEGYGLTETSPVVSANRPGERKLGSVGRPIPGVTVRIDEAHGSAPGEGEIVIYGPNVMKGYHQRPEETARAFTADGGFRTGDIGRIDADGYLFITGRIKEQYKLENGKYVMPTPLEEHLALSPYVTNVMLYGADRPFNVALVALDVDKVRAWAGEHGVALEGDPAGHPAVRELIGQELDRLSADFRSYERPRAFALTSEPLTIANDMLTPTLKLKRRNVIARFGATLDALYAEPPWTPPPARPAPVLEPAPAGMR